MLGHCWLGSRNNGPFVGTSIATALKVLSSEIEAKHRRHTGYIKSGNSSSNILCYQLIWFQTLLVSDFVTEVATCVLSCANF